MYNIHIQNIMLLIMLLFINSCIDDDQFRNSDSIFPDKECMDKAERKSTNTFRKIIGPAGGTLESSDKVLSVTIPSGSLDQNYSITIESIENSNPSGVGVAYRILPNNLIFQQPVRIGFKYKEEELKSFPEALLLAYKDNDCVWKAIGGLSLDTENHIVSVTSSHLGDWSLCESLRLEKHFIASPGELKEITINQFINPQNKLPLAASIFEGEESPVKLVKESISIGIGFLENDYFLHKNGKIYFDAPLNIPESNPIPIILQIPSTPYLLTSHIIIANEGLLYRINDGEWNHCPMVQFNTLSGISHIKSFSENEHQLCDVNIFFNNETGKIQWKSDIPQLTILHKDSQYLHYYISEDKPMLSTGYLQIVESKENSTHIIGNFILDKAGIYNTHLLNGDPITGTAKVEGIFVLKK